MTVPPGSTDSSSCQQCTVPAPFFARLRCCYTLPVTRLGTHTTSLPGSGVSPNTVQIRRGDKRGRTKTKRQSRWHTQAIKHFKKERTCLMIATIPENGLQDKVCQHLSLGLLQDVLPVSQIEELLETYQMWEQRERQLNMVAIVYWLIGLHLYPHLSQRAVYAKLV